MKAAQLSDIHLAASKPIVAPADRPQADKLATELKTAMAELDEAARLQDGARLSKEYIKVASGFGAYAEVIPSAALN